MFGKAENPTTKATFTQAVRKFIGTNSHWRVHTYESMDQVPTDALHGVADSGAYGWVAPDSKGVLHAHFVLDRIEQGTELGKMLHEIGAHIGLSNILPKELYQNLHSKIAEWALEARLAADQGELSQEQAIALKAWGRMSDNTKGMSEAVKTDELIAYFIEEAVAAGIDPTGIKTKGTLGQILRKVWAAFKAALRKLRVQNIDQLTPQNIVDLAYGAARLDLDAGTATASTAEPLRFGHPESRGNLDFIPEPYRKSAANIIDSIADAAKNGHYGLAFLHDLVDHIEAKAKPLAESVRSFKDAVDRIGVARQRFEKRASDVMAVTSSMKPEQVDQINQYLDFARRNAAWGYQPEWLPDPVEIKDESKTEFDKLSSVQQQVVKDVHRILHENLTEKRRLLSQRIKDHYAALIEQTDDDALVARLEAERDSKIKQLPTLLQMSGPYSPWKRYGSHVVAYHSPELREAFDNEDHKLVAELRKDAKHYVLEFAEGYGEARTRARKLAEEFGEDNVQYFEKAAWRDQIPGRFADLEKLKRTISQLPTAATKGDKASQARLEGMVEELILQSLTQDHARQSNRKAEGVAGADPDMLRSFADQARADAHHMSNLMHLGDANQALRDLARAAEKGSGQDRHAYQKMANAIYWHWEKTLDYVETPIADRLTAVSSTWHLLTSVGYHIQNATQVEMMSVPYMAKDHGYGTTQAATLKAYKDMSGMIKGSKFWDHLKTDLVPDDVKQAIKDLEDQGVIDIFMDLELGTISNAPGANKLTRSGRKVLEALRRMPAKIETVNRVVTATAAYRLAKPRLGHEKAVKYAREVIETTHGTYSGLETPKFISPKRWGGGAKIVFQFRKFQLIQLAYMAKLINSAAFKPEERAAALRALGFTFGHYGLMGGALGLPAMGAAQLAAGALFGLGGDDDPWDKDAQEYRFRKWADDNGIEDGWVDLILRGAPGALGVNLTDKVGAQHMLSILPFTKFDPKEYNNFQEIAFDALGPSASMLSRMWSGVGHFQQHDVVGGMEKMMPSGVSDAIKAFRMQQTGERTYNGDTVISPEELSLVDSALTAIGFTPMTIQDRWSRQRVLKSYEDAYQARTKTLKREYTEARSERNFRKARELEREWQALQKNKRAAGMRSAPITDLRKAPQEKAKREANVAGGVKFDSGNQAFVRELGELY